MLASMEGYAYCTGHRAQQSVHGLAGLVALKCMASTSMETLCGQPAYAVHGRGLELLLTAECLQCLDQ